MFKADLSPVAGLLVGMEMHSRQTVWWFLRFHNNFNFQPDLIPLTDMLTSGLKNHQQCHQPAKH